MIVRQQVMSNVLQSVLRGQYHEDQDILNRLSDITTAVTEAAGNSAVGETGSVSLEPCPVTLHARHMDQIDAVSAGQSWLDAVIARRCSDAPHELQYLNLARDEHIIDGTLILLWSCGVLLAQVSIVRDDWNWSILTCTQSPGRDAGGISDTED